MQQRTRVRGVSDHNRAAYVRLHAVDRAGERHWRAVGRHDAQVRRSAVDREANVGLVVLDPVSARVVDTWLRLGDKCVIGDVTKDLQCTYVLLFQYM